MPCAVATHVKRTLREQHRASVRAVVWLRRSPESPRVRSRSPSSALHSGPPQRFPLCALTGPTRRRRRPEMPIINADFVESECAKRHAGTSSRVPESDTGPPSSSRSTRTISLQRVLRPIKVYIRSNLICLIKSVNQSL